MSFRRGEMALFGRQASIGFWAQDQGLEAAFVRRRGKGWKVAGHALARAEELLSGDGRQERLTEAFRNCLKSLPREARRADIAAVLAVSDWCVEEDVLTFAEFPTVKAEARALVAHRMGRELGVPADDLAVSWETFRGQNEVKCRVRAMDRHLRDDVEAAAARVGIRLVRIDGWSGVASGASALADHRAGSAVWSDGADWSLICWSEADPVGFCQHGRATQPAQMMEDTVRLSRSYAEGQGVAELPFLADVPEGISESLDAAVRGAGMTFHPIGGEPRRSVQVAVWG